MQAVHTIPVALFGIVWAPIAVADAPETNESYSLVDRSDGAEIEFAYGTPSSPALALAGLNASEVTKVNEVRRFVASLPSTFDGDGGTALALDFRPGLLFDQTLFDYTEESFIQRIARRSAFGLAVKEGQSNPEQSRRSLVSLGISSSVFDNSDPVYALFDRDNPEIRVRCHEAYSRELLDHLHDDIAEYSEAEDYLGAARRNVNFQISDVNEIDIYNEKLRIAHTHLIDVHRLLSHGLRDDGLEAPAAFAARPQTLAEVMLQATILRLETQRLDTLLKSKKSKKVNAELKRSSDYCSAAIRDVVKFSSNLDVGLGFLWRGKSADLGSFEDGGKALWLSYRHPFRRTTRGSSQPNSYWVAGLSGRAGFSELVETGNDTLKESKADTLQAWAGIEYFSQSWRMNARYGYAETRFDDPAAVAFSNDGEQWLVGGNFRLGSNSNVWIGLEYGDAQGTTDALSGETLKITFTLSEPAALSIFGDPGGSN